MTITVDYPMLEQLRKNIEYSDKIKNRLFKEFITWYFGAYLDQSRTLDKTAKAHWFNRLNHELENDFEATINQFLKDNYTEEE